jgi:hypothetical protein
MKRAQRAAMRQKARSKWDWSSSDDEPDDTLQWYDERTQSGTAAQMAVLTNPNFSSERKAKNGNRTAEQREAHALEAAG